MKQIIVLSIFSLLFRMHISAQSSTFELAGHTVEAGKRVSFNIPVRAPSGDSTHLPITVIHGQKPGPVLGLVAGLHGYEYPPIIALQQLPDSINAEELKGTVVLVHIANVNAFLGRNVYYNPVDYKNLNRMFPGSKTGTITECIAWTISHVLFPKFNYYIDVHAGDGSEDLHPYIGYTVHGKQTATAQQMAEAMGFGWIMRSERRITKGQPTVYSSSESASQGIPTIAIESGKLGMVTDENIKQINNGILNVMRTLRLLPGKPHPVPPAMIFTKRSNVNSEHNGIFYSEYRSGQLIRKGTKLGYVTDFFGNHLQDVVAPVDGVIVYIIATPPINKGELLVNMAELPR